MSMSLSPNTQAILLLTAPLMAGRNEFSSDLLTPGEYKRLVKFLRDMQLQPADLLVPDARALPAECLQFIDSDRIKRLLARGFLLSQAIDRWQTLAIWVLSSADAEYPRRLKPRLNDDAPPVLYGCGEITILNTGGLAVVGSRHVDEALIAYTEDIGRLVAKAGRTLVSGGARGIDQAAMRGALEAGGNVTGVLADSLERMALNRELRNFLMDRQLALVSPYDPAAGFNVGHAMQRNKLIYALAESALVVSSDYEKGGTWAGAVEQLQKLQLVPVYVRSNGKTSKGLDELRHRGALAWPNPATPEAIADVLTIEVSPRKIPSRQNEFFASAREEPNQTGNHQPIPSSRVSTSPSKFVELPLTPASEQFVMVRNFLEKMTTPKTDAEVAAALSISKKQAKEWLQEFVEKGLLERYKNPVRYGPKVQRPIWE
ncbi:MAG: DNA-processing protein DprA [bacterium]